MSDNIQRTCGDAGGIKKDGSPCGNFLNLSPESGRCLNHDEARANEAQQIRAEGGRAGGESKRGAMVALPSEVPDAPKTLDDAADFASWLTRAVCIGTLDARTAHESAYALNCFKAAVEKRDMQREIEQLRKQLDELKKRRVA